MDLSLSTLSSGEFTLLYILLFAVAVVASLAISVRMRPDGQGGAVASMQELAILSGGRKRFVEAVAAKLVGDGSLDLMSNGEFTVAKPNVGINSAERAVLHLDSPFKWPELAEAVRIEGVALEEGLVAKGWLMDDSEAMRLRVLLAAPFMVLLMMGCFRYVAVSAQSEPVGGLLFLLFVAALAALGRVFRFDQATNAGRDVLAMNVDESSRLKRAPESNELGHAVALYGTGILAGTAFASLHLTKAQGSVGGGCGTAGGGDSGNDSWGDSGCGGGGCGGCGG
jgi:uncharacterized protein (TIGR04222 family)